MSVPVAVGTPGVAVPASITEPVVVPEMISRVVAAGDRDRHQLGRAVHGRDREAVAQGAAGIERLHRAVGVVERVGPHAGRRHREAAVAARARRRSNRHKSVERIVEVGIGERAGRGRHTWRGSAGLDHRASRGAGDDRRVVAAGDRDRHQLGCAVHGGHREAVAQGAAGIERLHRGVGIVERVGPHAGRRHREAAVAARARRRSNRHKSVDRIVEVGIGERAGRGRHTWRGSAGLDHRASRGAGDDRRVVAAGDRDRHQLGCAVHGGHREAVAQGAAGIERLHRAVGVVERVGPHAGRRHREAAVAARARRRSNRHKSVERIVEVGIGERAGRGRHTWRGSAGLDHRASRGAGDEQPRRCCR